MSGQQGWQCQGRQEHGYFGSGTCGDGGEAGDLFGADGLPQRIAAVAYGATAALPAPLRRRGAAAFDGAALARLTAAMTAWLQGANMAASMFADEFFDRSVDEAIAGRLRDAATQTQMARNHADLAAAARTLAAAMQAVGLDRWPRVLAMAAERAGDPATLAAIARRQRSEPKADPIVPVYPLETMMGIGAAGVAGGAGGALLAGARALLRQVLPPPKPSEAPPAPTAPARMDEAVAPAARKYTIPPDRAQHILDMHGPGRNLPDKTEFPPGWSDDRIIGVIDDVANDPASEIETRIGGRTVISGRRDGVDVLVAIGRDGKTVVTAHPTNLPRNPMGN